MRIIIWTAMLVCGFAAAGARATWDTQALETLFAYAHSENSTGVVIFQRGEVVAERHWPAPDNDSLGAMLAGTTQDGRTREDVASVQKSVVSYLVGIAVAQDLIDLEAPVARYLGPGWSQAPQAAEARINVRHLLSMTSGLRPNLRVARPPGEQWRYNTRAYSKLVPVLEAAVGRTIGEITAQWLTQPLGMRDSAWAQRTWVRGGLDANAWGFVTTARDLARFGNLILNRGRSDVVPAIDGAYFDAMLSASQSLNTAYGYLWWLNGAAGVNAQGNEFASLIETAPSDLVAALGALGRKVYVVPSLDLVVTRTGGRTARDFDERFWETLKAAMAANDRNAS